MCAEIDKYVDSRITGNLDSLELKIYYDTSARDTTYIFPVLFMEYNCFTVSNRSSVPVKMWKIRI